MKLVNPLGRKTEVCISDSGKVAAVTGCGCFCATGTAPYQLTYFSALQH